MSHKVGMNAVHAKALRGSHGLHNLRKRNQTMEPFTIVSANGYALRVQTFTGEIFQLQFSTDGKFAPRCSTDTASWLSS